jgi:hypothetical protein
MRERILSSGQGFVTETEEMDNMDSQHLYSQNGVTSTKYTRTMKDVASRQNPSSLKPVRTELRICI